MKYLVLFVYLFLPLLPFFQLLAARAALTTSPLTARALVAGSAAVGTVMVAAEAVVRTRPPAVVKEAAVIGSNVGAALVESSRQREAIAMRTKPKTFMFSCSVVLLLSPCTLR